MTQATEEALRRRIGELEDENASLRAERKLLRDIICNRTPPGSGPDEVAFIEMMHNPDPGSGRRLLEELGVFPPSVQ